MPASKKLPPTVWVSEAIRSVKNIFSIGLGFPPEIYDYPTYYALYWKRTKSQWQDSTVVFTEEDEKKINALHESGKELNRTFRNFEKLAVLPEKLWYGLLPHERDRFPKEHHHIFKVINRGMVVSEACAQLLQGFRLGETQLAPVRIYRLDNGELLDNRLYYFLNICEQRRYFRVEASDAAFTPMVHVYYQGQQRYDLKGKDIEHDAYALDKAALECDVDLWADPALAGMIFVSPALREALREARMDKAWFLYRCQLV